MALRFNRGHQQSTRSNSVSSAREANNSSASTSKLGASSMKFVQRYLDECRSFYSCIYCRTHLANHDELISRSFQGNRSRAYLFNSVVNVSCGPSVQRELNTGSHSVADIFCTNCGTTIGWKYEKAFVDSQRYKEGKYIIELAHVVRENRHLELDKRDIFLGLVPQVSSQITNSAPPEKQQAANCNGDATIGTNHQGSLSPASSSGGQWSPGNSSASTSSSSSSSSNEMDTLRPSCRYETTASERRQQWLVVDDLDNDDPDEIDDDEVLMFPFYDDFYGNRSSYSNLSTTRNHQKRLRRSLYLENTMAPYDLTRHTYAAGGSTSSSSVSPTAAAAAAVERAGPTLQTRETPQRPTRLLETPNLCPSSACSSSFIEIPVLNHQTGHQTQQSDNNNSSRQQLAANRRFFASASSRSSPLEIIPPQPTSALSPSTANNIKGDSGTNSELATRAHTSSFSNHQLTDHPVDDEDTQFEFEHDKQPAAVVEIEQTQAAAGTSTNASLDYRRDSNQSKHSIQPDGQETNCELITLAVNCSEVESSSTGLVRELSSHASSSVVDDASSNGPSQVTAMDVSETSSSSRSMAKTQSSLSFDDEEFYDCNTDHDISNTNSLETTNK